MRINLYFRILFSPLKQKTMQSVCRPPVRRSFFFSSFQSSTQVAASLICESIHMPMHRYEQNSNIFGPKRKCSKQFLFERIDAQFHVRLSAVNENDSLNNRNDNLLKKNLRGTIHNEIDEVFWVCGIYE